MVKETNVGHEPLTPREIKRLTKHKGRKVLNALWTVLIIFLILSAATVGYVNFKLTPIYVDGQSMAPTLNDVRITQSSSYYEFGYMDDDPQVLDNLKRGDIVVAVQEINSEVRHIIKRVIALPFETVKIEKGESNYTTYVKTEGANFTTVNEPYISSNYEGINNRSNYAIRTGHGVDEEFTLGAGEFYLLGDNRANSSDSRSFGAILREQLVGKLLFVNGYAKKVTLDALGNNQLHNKVYYVVWKWRFY